MNNLNELLASYTVKVSPLPAQDGGGYKAIYEELGLTVRGIGATVTEAISELEELALDGLADEPIADFPAAKLDAPWAEYSGRITLRLPKMLHAQLDRLAEEQGVSLNQLITHAMQSAATALLAGQEFGIHSRHNVNELFDTISTLRSHMDVWSVADLKANQNSEGLFHGVPLRKTSKLLYQSMEAMINA